jgi:hypothetical protein
VCDTADATETALKQEASLKDHHAEIEQVPRRPRSSAARMGSESLRARLGRE